MFMRLGDAVEEFALLERIPGRFSVCSSSYFRFPFFVFLSFSLFCFLLLFYFAVASAALAARDAKRQSGDGAGLWIHLALPERVLCVWGV